MHNPNLNEIGPLRQRAADLRDLWADDLLGRSRLLELLLIATLTGEPILIVGPPGSGKTAALRDFIRSFGYSPLNLYEYLITRDTEPVDIEWSPSDARSATTPDAELGALCPTPVIHFQELFHARGRLLNHLLRWLDHRRVRQVTEGAGDDSTLLPLVVGSSCEVAESTEHAALRDRFSIKTEIERIDEELFATAIAVAFQAEQQVGSRVATSGPFLGQFGEIGVKNTQTEPNPRVCSPTDLHDLQRCFLAELQAWAASIGGCGATPGLTAEVASSYQQLVRILTREDRLFVSHRKIYTLYKLMLARAWLAGQSQIRTEDLSMLAYLGETREEIALLRDKVPVLLARLG